MILLSRIDMNDFAHVGGEYLDIVRPAWPRDIVLPGLDLRTYDNCVLGQLYGGYDEGVQALGISWGETAALGFSVRGTSISEEFRQRVDRTHLSPSEMYGQRLRIENMLYRELTDVWVRQIQERLDLAA